MYGLPQAARLANDQLILLLAKTGYAPVPHTPGLWAHTTQPITFTLVVDDFGIKYLHPNDAHHLLTALQQHYTIKQDRTGTRYCGQTIQWDYTARTCDISIPGYIAQALQRFTHPAPNVTRLPPIHGRDLPMAPKHNSLLHLTPVPPLTPKPRNTSRKSLAPSFSMQGLLTTPSYQPLEPLQPNKARAPLPP
jgi:hypothetical protein